MCSCTCRAAVCLAGKLAWMEWNTALVSELLPGAHSHPALPFPAFRTHSFPVFWESRSEHKGYTHKWEGKNAGKNTESGKTAPSQWLLCLPPSCFEKRNHSHHSVLFTYVYMLYLLLTWNQPFLISLLFGAVVGKGELTAGNLASFWEHVCSHRQSG